jgi:hypothetical protein
VNRIQFDAGGGTLPNYLNEGMADYWAGNTFGINTFGAWWAGNCAAPSQDGWMPRVAEATDVFPTRVTGANFAHGRGQVIAWALWRSRTGADGLNTLGPLSFNMNLMAALTATGLGGLNGNQHQRIHDAYVDLLGQIVTRYANNLYGHKVLSGFARAGLFLDPADAIVDIDDDFLDSNAAAGPTFTAWGGRAYTFNADESVNIANTGCNTRATIEVASDNAFTTDFTSSGTLNTAVSGGSCNVAWTLPAAAWNTIKARDRLFYRATTTDAGGGNGRSSLAPGGPAGNPFTTLPPAVAYINSGGEQTCNCSCAAAGGITSLLFALPFAVGVLSRRRIKLRESEARSCARA